MTEPELLKHRTEWIRREHDKHRDNQNFENGFRAGLDCALMALAGRDILGQSIDPPSTKKGGRKPK